MEIIITDCQKQSGHEKSIIVTSVIQKRLLCAQESKIEFAYKNGLVIKKSYHGDIDHKDACW